MSDLVGSEGKLKELSQQVRLLDAVLSTTPDFAYLFDRDGRFVYVNPALLKVWGRTLEDCLGKTCLELGYEQWHHDMHMTDIANVIRTRKPIRGEVPFTAPLTGHYGFYDYFFQPVFGHTGEVEFIAGTTRDVTEMKRAARALQTERENLSMVISQAPSFIAVLRGPTHIFELANEQYFTVVGRRDILGKPIAAALPEVADQGYFELLDEVYRTGKSHSGNEVPVLLGPEDARVVRYVNFVYQPMREGDGRISGVFVHGVDVTSVVRSRDELRSSKERYQSLFDSMNEGFCVIEMIWGSNGAAADYRFLEINPAFEQNTGIHEGVGRRMREIAPKHEQFWFDTYGEVARTGKPAGFEHEAAALGRWYDVSAFRIGRAEDNRVAILFNDVTQRKTIELEKEQLFESERTARAESERASRMKDEFLATLSHEIRTPLNAILGWSQIMGHSQDPNDIKDGIEVIERNARAQSQIIEDLLDMSRIISGKVRLEVRPLMLADIVRTAIETARPAAEARDIQIKAILDPLTDVTVNGDAGRLQQVMWNLLSNAVKFTARGGTVQVILTRVKSHLEVSVIDTGEGIPAAFMPFIFDRFRQADASITRRHGGLGLGLSIVKQLVELHGGTVRAESAGEGCGSRFTVNLPFAALKPYTQAPLEAAQATEFSVAPELNSNIDLTGLRILVVDDELDARAMIRRLLEEFGAKVTIIGNATAAFAELRAGDYDMLISDIGMPGEDGYSLIRRVRELGKGKGTIPAIALTAYARAEDRVRAISSGFQQHLVKPVEAGELVAVVAATAGRIS